MHLKVDHCQKLNFLPVEKRVNKKKIRINHKLLNKLISKYLCKYFNLFTTMQTEGV